jgi:uncharacterized membrane protein (DUF2068 family)
MPPTTKARPRKSQTKTKTKPKGPAGLLLIGLFKLVKAVLLVFVGLGAIHFLRRDLGDSVVHWVDLFRVDPDNKYVHSLIAKAFSVTPRQLKEVSAGTFFYAAILGTEGVGLLMRKHWAEYFTVISTGVFLPLEIYELFHHFTWVKVAVLVTNAAIVWYLVVQIRREKTR